MWAILQSLSQLDAIYGPYVRENFIANSGAIEIFNMNDNLGCKYFSEKMGSRQVKVAGFTESQSIETRRQLEPRAGQNSGSLQYSLVDRPWLQPHELPAIDPNLKIVFQRGYTGPEGENFRYVRKVWVNDHPRLKVLLGG